MANMTKIELEKYRLIMFDVDGTLVKAFTAEFLPDVMPKLKTLSHERIQTAIVTNQGGPSVRQWMETKDWGHPFQFPTLDDVLERITDIRLEIVQETSLIPFVYISTAFLTKDNQWWNPHLDNKQWANNGCGNIDNQIFYGKHKHWRKPQPGMLLAAIARTSSFERETLMVGDRQEDEQAAKNARCDFVHRDIFFGANPYV